MALKDNYKDYQLDIGVNPRARYRMIDNGDGTVSFEDVTVYVQEGDSYGASDMNAVADAVNNIGDSCLDTMEEVIANTESGRIAGALAVKELASKAVTSDNIGSQSVNYAASAGAVAWDKVSSKPTLLKVTSFNASTGALVTTS